MLSQQSSGMRPDVDVPAHYQPAPIQIVRDARGVILGRIEHEGSTGRIVARNAQGSAVATFDPRDGVTRDKRGLVVARGDVLAAYLFCP